ncbi:hypothetical protein ACLKA6_001578 [Drosophila palustris]
MTCAQNKLTILPVYLNCNNWKQDFEDLYNWLLEFEDDNIMIVGDLNARIGERQVQMEDDITEGLPGGVKLGAHTIKVLMYADDMVMLADSPESLQKMINFTYNYCIIWNLQINLDKSKIMCIKDTRGRLARNEKWTLNGSEIEVVKEYKYLGAVLTPTMSFNKHLQQKLKEAKAAINSTWSSILVKKEVKSSIKYKLFEATSKAIMCNSAQVWGHTKYDEVEKLLLFFTKRLFRLPTNTPSYAIMLETGLAPLYTNTLNQNFSYLRKVMALEDWRLPNIVATHMLQSKSQCFKVWCSLARSLDVRLSLEDQNSWKVSHQNIIEALKKSSRQRAEEQARQSETRVYYRSLEYNLGPRNYFSNDFKAYAISTIFRARVELLRLNYSTHRREQIEECSLCNRREREDSFHFIATCPMLQEIRRIYWNKDQLDFEKFQRVLNGESWPSLIGYLNDAQKYRLQIIEEFR